MFVPVGAMEGVNLAQREPAESPLFQWYKGPTLVDLLGMSQTHSYDAGV